MGLLQGQSKALALAIGAVEGCMAELIDLAWDAYATPRWKPGTNTERIASGDGGRKSCSFRTHAEASVAGFS